LRFIQWFPF